MVIIHRLVRWWREITKPGVGAHRAGQMPPVPAVTLPRPAPALCLSPRPRLGSPYGLDKPLDGDAQRLVRPYVVAHERRQRRRVLYTAVALGVELDSRIIHSAGVVR